MAAILSTLAACGGGSSKPTTTAAWQQRHGATVADVGTALDQTATATMGGDPVAIRTSCSSLQDSVGPARAALPVPGPKADAALRTALDQVSTGAADCLRAMASGDARLLEKSISELQAARLQLDTANAALTATATA